MNFLIPGKTDLMCYDRTGSMNITNASTGVENFPYASSNNSIIQDIKSETQNTSSPALQLNASDEFFIQYVHPAFVYVDFSNWKAYFSLAGLIVSALTLIFVTAFVCLGKLNNFKHLTSWKKWYLSLCLAKACGSIIMVTTGYAVFFEDTIVKRDKIHGINRTSFPVASMMFACLFFDLIVHTILQILEKRIQYLVLFHHAISVSIVLFVTIAQKCIWFISGQAILELCVVPDVLTRLALQGCSETNQFPLIMMMILVHSYYIRTFLSSYLLYSFVIYSPQLIREAPIYLNIINVSGLCFFLFWFDPKCIKKWSGKLHREIETRLLLRRKENVNHTRKY